MQTNFYRILLRDDVPDKLRSPDDDYVVGEDVILEGENTELLSENSEVSITVNEFSDFIDIDNDDYYRQLLLEEDISYGLNKYNYSDLSISGPSEKEIKLAKKVIRPYIKKAVFFGIAFITNAKLTDKIEITKITIPGINFEYSFDSFVLNNVDLPKQTELFDEYVDSQPGFGMWSGQGSPRRMITQITGTVLKPIQKINVRPTSDDWILITKDNVDQLNSIAKNKYDEEDAFSVVAQKYTDFETGDNFDLSPDMLIKDWDTEKAHLYDTTKCSYVVEIETGNPYNPITCCYTYDNNVRQAEFLFYRLLHELRGEGEIK
jgi:hypothetical protein